MSAGTGNLSIRRHARDAVEIVVVAGELDMASAPTLREELDRIDFDKQSVVLDISDLTFIDSHGLHLLLGLPDEGRLVVVRPRTNIVRVLHLTDAERVLSMSDTLEHAIQRVNHKPQTTSVAC
jgi:anti-anti-sigma factor